MASTYHLQSIFSLTSNQPLRKGSCWVGDVLVPTRRRQIKPAENRKNCSVPRSGSTKNAMHPLYRDQQVLQDCQLMLLVPSFICLIAFASAS
jgi:hypothetical protein